MKLGWFFVGVSLAMVTASPGTADVAMTADSFEGVVDKQPFAFVKFFAPWLVAARSKKAVVQWTL